MKPKLFSLFIGLAIGATGLSLAAQAQDDPFGGDEGDMEMETDPFGGDRLGEDEIGEKEVLEFVRTHSPGYHDALGKLRRENPEEYQARVEDVSHFIREYREIERHEPEEAEVMLKLEVNEVESELIARRFHESTNPKEKEQLREQLGKMLNHLFELKQHAHEKEVHYLEREMTELRERLHRRAENRERIIQRRMQDLLDEEGDDWMDW